MAMTVVVTRNVPDRYRGFLASCMCEIAPGVYTAPRMTVAVRKRIWRVLERWFTPGSDRAVVMTWRSPKAPGGQEFQMLGVPRKDLVNHHGIYLSCRDLTAKEGGSLTN